MSALKFRCNQEIVKIESEGGKEFLLRMILVNFELNLCSTPKNTGQTKALHLYRLIKCLVLITLASNGERLPREDNAFKLQLLTNMFDFQGESRVLLNFS